MPPMLREEHASERTSQTAEDSTQMNRREEKARENSSDDEEGETSSQLQRVTAEGIQEREPARTDSSFSIEKAVAKKPTYDQNLSYRSFGSIMDRVRALSNFLPTIFPGSNKNVPVSPQRGNFSRVSVAPVLREGQQAYLNSGIMESVFSTFEEEGKKKSVAFQLEEEKREAAGEELTIQDQRGESFADQEELERYSLVFAQLQQQLSRNVKAILESDTERGVRRTKLQTELNELRSEDNPETLPRRTEIKRELRDLKAMPEKNPVKLVQIAQFYAEAYPQARETAQQILRWAQEDPARQHEFTAILLADITINVLQIASKTVASNELIPIQRVKPIVFKKDRLLEPPYLNMNLEVYEDYKLPCGDLEHAVIVSAANRALGNLKVFKRVLQKISSQASPEEIGNDLRQAEVHRVSNDLDLAYEQSDCIDAKLPPLTMEPVYIPEEKRNRPLIDQLMQQLRAASSISNSLYSKLAEVRKSELIADPARAKSIAVAEVMSLAQSGLRTADDFSEMLEQRRKKD